MDSGNSGGGSMQSSSTGGGGGGGGGDEEFDSRAAADSSSISAFFNNPLAHHVSPLSNHHHHHHSSSSLFDPLSNYFDPSSSRVPQQPVQLTNPNNNSFLNLDMVWSKNLRSDPNPTDLTNFNPTQQFFTQTRPDYPSLQIHQPQPQLPPQQQQQQQEQPTSRPSPNTDQPNHNQNPNPNPNPNPVARNPKKRSRASRRAPTTVLTTDTSNFRAMVQEFTGIPAPPFTSSPFPRSRLDLFGGPSSTLRSVIASHHHHLDPTTAPPYLLRPFAQKLQQPLQPLSFAASSSMVDANASTVSAATNAAASNNNNNNASTSVNYQLPQQQQQQQQNLLNINQQNPLLNFQPMKYPPVFGSNPKQQQPSDHSGLKNMGGVLEDQFGLSQGHVSPSIQNSSNPAGSNWPGDDHQGTDHHHQNHHHRHHQDLLRSINGNYSNTSSQQQQQQRGGGGVNGTKVVNFSASSSDFHGDKGQEISAATTARNEGVMESWICSSD